MIVVKNKVNKGRMNERKTLAGHFFTEKVKALEGYLVIRIGINFFYVLTIFKT